MCIQQCLSKHTGKPRATYQSEYEVNEAVRYVLDTHGNDVVPYLCGKCKLWHLSPKERHTPSHDCLDCTDRYGKIKQSYVTEKCALNRAKIRGKSSGKKLRVFPCPYGDGWHLTSG